MRPDWTDEAERQVKETPEERLQSAVTSIIALWQSSSIPSDSCLAAARSLRNLLSLMRNGNNPPLGNLTIRCGWPCRTRKSENSNTGGLRNVMKDEEYLDRALLIAYCARFDGESLNAIMLDVAGSLGLSPIRLRFRDEDGHPFDRELYAFKDVANWLEDWIRVLESEIWNRSEIPYGWDVGKHVWPNNPITEVSHLRDWLSSWLEGVHRERTRGEFANPERYLGDIQRELRNARLTMRIWKITAPTGFDDDPRDIHEAERQLELLIDSLTELNEKSRIALQSMLNAAQKKVDACISVIARSDVSDAEAERWNRGLNAATLERDAILARIKSIDLETEKNSNSQVALVEMQPDRKVPTCPADLEPTNAKEMLRREIAKRIAPSLGPLPPSGEHEKAMKRLLDPFLKSPHHKAIWDHYNNLRRIESADLPQWEREAKAAGLTLQDFIDKLALPRMKTFLALNGIPLPPEASEVVPDEEVINDNSDKAPKSTEKSPINEAEDGGLAMHLDPLTPLQQRVLKALWNKRFAVQFDTLRNEAWEGKDVDNGTIKRQLERMKARWFQAGLVEIDIEISVATNSAKLRKPSADKMTDKKTDS